MLSSHPPTLYKYENHGYTAATWRYISFTVNYKIGKPIKRLIKGNHLNRVPATTSYKVNLFFSFACVSHISLLLLIESLQQTLLFNLFHFFVVVVLFCLKVSLILSFFFSFWKVKYFFALLTLSFMLFFPYLIMKLVCVFEKLLPTLNLLVIIMEDFFCLCVLLELFVIMGCWFDKRTLQHSKLNIQM